MIHFLKNGTLMNNRFEKAFLLIPDLKEPENKFMVVLTVENFIYMSFKTKKKVYINFNFQGMDFSNNRYHKFRTFAFRN